MLASAAQQFEVHPRRLADVLVDPEAIERWSPVPFRITGEVSRRLRRGDHVTVEASLVGKGLRFEVAIEQADERGLTLHASGPFELEARYAIDPGPSRVSAEVETWGGGLRGRVFASAANTLLSAGILDDALARLIDEASDHAFAGCVL